MDDNLKLKPPTSYPGWRGWTSERVDLSLIWGVVALLTALCGLVVIVLVGALLR
jgi:phosphotransferase system  glucose/maltose/N-acetylglucosamine-specific IIC component